MVKVVDFAAEEQARLEKRKARKGGKRKWTDRGSRSHDNSRSQIGGKKRSRRQEGTSFHDAWKSVMDLGESARDKKQAKKAKNEALRRIGIRVPNEKMPYNILKSMKKTHARRQKKRDEEDLASGLVTAKSSKKKKKKKQFGDPGLRELTAGKFKRGVLYLS